MSLIPSESLNFPDSFRATVRRESAKKNNDPSPRPRTETLQIIPAPSPDFAAVQETEPRRVPEMQEIVPALAEVDVTPSAAPVEATVAPTATEANSTPVKPAKIALVPRAKVRSLCKPEPADKSNGVDVPDSTELVGELGGRVHQIASGSAAKSEEMIRLGRISTRRGRELPRAIAEPYPRNFQLTTNKRRRHKVFRFLLGEAVAVALLVALAKLGVSGRFNDQTIILLINILIVAAAAAVAALPIISFGIVPARSREER